MHYAAIGEYLEKLQGENSKLSLHTIGLIIAHLPFPVESVKYVQVAGTNGKGSTSHFIAAILRSAGWRVGLFTSPHLQDVRERICLNGRMITQKHFARAITVVDGIVRGLLRRRVIAQGPTFFETLFLAALVHFCRSRADWAVLEVGLGGRLDATSTVVPEVAVITNIAKDHTQILGKTLAAIAREKAGVCKKNVPLVSGCPHSSFAGRVIAREARRKKSPLHLVFAGAQSLRCEKNGPSYLCHYDAGGHRYEFQVYLKGRHQTVNAAVAVKTADVLQGLGWKIPTAAIRRGIRAMFIPGRLELLSKRPPVIIDGSHNSDGVRVLTDFLREENIQAVTLIFGVLGDKHYRGMARQLAPLAANVILSAPPNPRALPPEKLLPFFKGTNCRVERDLAKALAIAKKLKRTIIVCGSLYLAGALRTVACGGKKYGRQKIKGN
ncbi:MAG: bifunctional folylpolyglutamate synthase/dihydrofolate synthase [Candidatus Aminicenantes bacterium]|nr:bifunctional folylpolyglutamate synthase/dihydrofolate synthase [Candidatus Aminicenantes bacterium]